MTARPGRWEPMAEAQRQRSKRRHVRRLLRRYDRVVEAAAAASTDLANLAGAVRAVAST